MKGFLCLTLLALVCVFAVNADIEKRGFFGIGCSCKKAGDSCKIFGGDCEKGLSCAPALFGSDHKPVCRKLSDAFKRPAPAPAAPAA